MHFFAISLYMLLMSGSPLRLGHHVLCTPRYPKILIIPSDFTSFLGVNLTREKRHGRELSHSSVLCTTAEHGSYKLPCDPPPWRRCIPPLPRP